MKKKALIAGATGLVGKELLPLLLEEENYEEVVALVRRPLGLNHPKLKEVVCDFDLLEEVKDAFAVQDVFCCLGTTIKKAKTKEVMYKIDVDYPMAIARLSKKQGAKHFLLISSMSANPKSKIWYSKMKGELEEKLKAVPFDAVSIFQPSLLVGDRQEFRLGESIGIKAFRLVSGLLNDSQKHRFGIEASLVARSMCQTAQRNKESISVYNANQMVQLLDQPFIRKI
jgi:uncharacterized protein YbjT (DUF2867 family)